jgi:molybdopterin converting factor small subunit
MPVYYSGKKFHYRFRVKGKRHYGICEGCTTEEQALAYEAQVNARLREEVKAAQEKLRQEEQKIAFNNNVRSLVENYRQVLNDGKKVSLADAYALYSRKPSRKRKCCDKTRKQKERSSIGRKSTGFQKSSDGS